MEIQLMAWLDLLASGKFPEASFGKAFRRWFMPGGIVLVGGVRQRGLFKALKPFLLGEFINKTSNFFIIISNIYPCLSVCRLLCALALVAHNGMVILAEHR